MLDVCTTGDTAHIDTIFKFLSHTTWISYRCVPCHQWCKHRTSLVVKKNFFSFPVAVKIPLTLNLPTTTIVAPPSNASKWQMEFNSAFKGLRNLCKPHFGLVGLCLTFSKLGPLYLHCVVRCLWRHQNQFLFLMWNNNNRTHSHPPQKPLCPRTLHEQWSDSWS